MAEEEKSKTAQFVDALQAGDNVKAGEVFKDALRDRVADSLDAHRQVVAGKIFNGVEAEPHSDPKPHVTDPNPETGVMVDTKGDEVPAATEAEAPATPEAPVNDESQPTT
jgi:hypothetical protein|tara:strand:- start:6 stop:335 length:330 start_codon:yes stop_codon:yes gene_type:complete